MAFSVVLELLLAAATRFVVVLELAMTSALEATLAAAASVGAAILVLLVVVVVEVDVLVVVDVVDLDVVDVVDVVVVVDVLVVVVVVVVGAQHSSVVHVAISPGHVASGITVPPSLELQNCWVHGKAHVKVDGVSVPSALQTKAEGAATKPLSH